MYSAESRKLTSVLQIAGMKRVKSAAVVPGMPEHLFLLADGQVRILNVPECRIELTLNPPNAPVFKIAATNEWLAVVADDGALELFHLPTIKAQLMPLESDVPTETVSGIATLSLPESRARQPRRHLKRDERELNAENWRNKKK